MRSFRGSSTSSLAFPVAGLYVMLTRSFGATDPSFDIGGSSFPLVLARAGTCERATPKRLTALRSPVLHVFGLLAGGRGTPPGPASINQKPHAARKLHNGARALPGPRS